MGDQFVSQREFDRYREATDRELARLERDLAELAEQREADLKAAMESRNTSWMRRIGMVSAGAGLLAAWVALVELMHSSGR